MKFTGKLKILSVLLFIAGIVLIVLVFAGINQMMANTDQPVKWVYIPLMLSLVVILALFLSAFALMDEKVYQAKVNELYKKKLELEEAEKLRVEKIQEENKAAQKNEIEAKQQETVSEEEIATWEKTLIPQNDEAKNELSLTEKYLTNLAKEFDFVQGVIFLRNKKDDMFTISGKYAFIRKTEPEDFAEGVTIPGQVALNKRPYVMDKIPADYITVLSGLGEANPKYLFLVPFVTEEKTIGVMELASFKNIEQKTQTIIEKVSAKFTDKLKELAV